jgi:hypothetical protein
VYSLIDNRLSAHLTRGGGVLVPAGSAGFAKYTRFANVHSGSAKKAWELRQLDGDIKVAKLAGKSATVFVPLTAAQAGRNLVRMRVKQGEEGTVSLRVNENKDINTKVAAGWSTVEIPVPEGQLKEGENDAISPSRAPVAGTGRRKRRSVTTARDFYDTAPRPRPAQGWPELVRAIPTRVAHRDLADGNCKLACSHGEDGNTSRRRRIGSAIDPALAARPRVSISKPRAVRKPSSPMPRSSCPGPSPW